MLQTFRNYPIFGLLIMGLLIAVFAVSGMFTPDSGMGGGAVGTVNGNVVSSGEFSRAYQRRMEMLRMYGIKDEQMKSFHLGEGVWQEIVSRKLVLDKSKDLGLIPSVEEVRDYIVTKYTPFQKDGKFDLEQYKGILRANNFTPAMFEKTVREELQAAHWTEYFAPAAVVTDTEVKWEHELQGNKRKFKYVLVGADVSKKVKPETVPAVLAAMGAGKSSDVKVEALLKEHNIKVVSTDWVTRKADELPNLGETEQAIRDGFAGKLSAPKRYDLVRGTLVVMVTDVQTPSTEISAEDRSKYLREISSHQERELNTRVMNSMRTKATIRKNEDAIKQFEAS